MPDLFGDTLEDRQYARWSARQAEKQELAARKAQPRVAAALEKACDEMNAYLTACVGTAREAKRGDDGRLRLIEQMAEYATYLRSLER